MSATVTIIDYGSGNLLSVSRAFDHVGAAAVLSGDPAAIENADRLVLPGVGAFADGMQGLRERGLVEAIRRYAASDRPLLGICLGSQLLATALGAKIPAAGSSRRCRRCSRDCSTLRASSPV